MPDPVIEEGVSPELEAVAPPPAKKRGYLVPGVIALVAVSLLAIVIDVAGLEHHDPSTLAGRDVSVFIAQAIQAEHPASTPPEISCPASEPVKRGVTFTCSWHRSDRSIRRIEVTEIGDQAQFTWKLAPS